MSRAEISICVESPDQPDARRLMDDLNAYLLSLYRPDECHHLTIGELCADDVSFFAARSGRALVGCGALRRIDETAAEVKRMYVLPSLQGNGIGGRVLAAIEANALANGITALFLETGSKQPDAVELYRKNGFTRRGPYLNYPDTGVSIFMEKRINA